MSDELDPFGRDQLIAAVRQALPTPIEEAGASQGSLRLTAGEPGEVVVDLADDIVTVAVFRGENEPPRTLGVIHWRSLPALATRRVLAELTAAASVMRRSTFRACSRCGRVVPPEQMTDEHTCRSCAESDFDVMI
jgi:hypothetical protein